MEYKNIINLLDNTANQPTRFSTNNWVEINDDARGTYNTSSPIKFKTSMPTSSLCNYSDAYLLVSWIITITGERWKKKVAAKQLDERNEGVIFKNCAPFTDCISEINNTQIDNANDLDVVMLIYNLIKYSYN